MFLGHWISHLGLVLLNLSQVKKNRNKYFFSKITLTLSTLVKGIRRISPDRQSSGDDFVKRKSPKQKNKKMDSSKSVLEFQFNSMLEMEGVTKIMQENAKYVII